MNKRCLIILAICFGQNDEMRCVFLKTLGVVVLKCYLPSMYSSTLFNFSNGWCVTLFAFIFFWSMKYWEIFCTLNVVIAASLSGNNSPLQTREKIYLLAVGYYRSGDYSRSRQLVERCLEVWSLHYFLLGTYMC